MHLCNMMSDNGSGCWGSATDELYGSLLRGCWPSTGSVGTTTTMSESFLGIAR